MTTGGKESLPGYVDPTPFLPSSLVGRPSVDLQNLAEVFKGSEDDELRAKISALRGSGSNLRQVGKELGMTARKASLTMSRLGIPTKMLPKKLHRT